MAYDPRKGIRAKQVYMSFTDAVRDSNDNLVLTGTDFTGNSFTNFWGAYYGDLAANSVKYYISDLGFDSTGVTDKFKTNEYDTIATATTNVLTLTSETTMTANALKNKWIIIKKANGKKILARIVSNTSSTLTLDSDVVTRYGVAASDTVVLLKTPFGLTMTAFARLDHIATNLTLTEPEQNTDDAYFFGTADDAGSQNMAIDVSPPGKFSGSITIRGGVQDLLRLKYASDSTQPSGEISYNLGSEQKQPIGFTAIWTTDASDTDAANDVTKALFCNDIKIKKVGILDTMASDGKAEATIEFEVKGGNTRLRVFTTQSDDVDLNV